MERSDIRARPDGKNRISPPLNPGYMWATQMRAFAMRSRIKSSIGIAITALALVVGAGDAFARPVKHKTVVIVHPRYAPPAPYAPYYYSSWNPFSIYSIYDHLSGGREQCQLPSEPCDNQHRVQN
jgi:hypothetical protein